MTETQLVFPNAPVRKPLSCGRTPRLARPRADVEAMLREMAYVYHLTRSLKEAITLTETPTAS